MPDHVNTYSQADKEKWLRQRGWVPINRSSGQTLWRHPDTSVPYIFVMAMKMALEQCRLPADFELKIEV